MKTLCVCFLFSSLFLFAQHPDDVRWDNRFSLPGISHPEYNGYPIRGVLALAALQNYIVIGGQFTVPGKNIVLWNKSTSSWEQIPDGVWKKPTQYSYPQVSGLYADGDSVFVWGNFTSAGSLTASNFAILHPATKTWTTDTMVNGSIYSMVRFGSDIIVKGNFTIKGTTIKNIARWSNGTWQAFSSDTTNIVTYTLSVFKNELYALARPQSSKYPAVLRWGGQSWINVIDSLIGIRASSLSLNHGMAASANYLYVYGGFDTIYTAGGSLVKAKNIVRYNGTIWESMADTIAYEGNFLIQSVVPDGDNLYIAGEMISVNKTLARGIARWDNTTKQWTSVGSGIPRTEWGTQINALALNGDDVYAAGFFPEAGGKFVNNIARFNRSSTQWYTLADANTLAPNFTANVFEDQGQLLAVGDFVYAGNKQLNHIGYWDGKAWNNIGSGIIRGTDRPWDGQTRLYFGPRGITKFSRIGKTMYVGGNFEAIASQPCDNIATYDNGTLQCVGGGLRPSHSGSSAGVLVPAYITSMQRIGSDLYVTGDFVGTGMGNIVESIVKWDGSTWDNLNMPIKQRAAFPDFSLAQDSSHALLLSGQFTSVAGKPCNGLARYDGSTWTPIGYNATDSIASFAQVCTASNGDIFVAGTLRNNGKDIINGVAKWDGNSWVNIGSLPSLYTSYIQVMAFKGNLLYIAGIFNSIGGINAKNVAVWNMETGVWSPLGSGLSKTIYIDTTVYETTDISSIAFVGDTVYFGGSFTYAGNKPSFNIAAWLPVKTTDVQQLSSMASTSSLRIAPNPTSANTTLYFSLQQSAYTRIVLYDMLGREVQSLLNRETESGSYSLPVDCSALNNGMYYCRVISGREVLNIPLNIAR